MKKFILHPATFKLDGGAMFGIIPKPLWSRVILADDLNRIPMSLRVVYLETKNRKILIDTGIGDYHPDKFKDQFAITNKEAPLVSILKNDLQVAPAEITDIILTHLHFDHVGGLGAGEKGTKPIFENATLHTHLKHWEYAQKATLRDRGSFQQQYFGKIFEDYLKKNQVHYVEGDHGIILEDAGEKVEFKTSFGHTPYMIHPIFEDYIYMADLVPMQHHVKLPWVMGYDIEPGVTTVYKEMFYQFIIDHKLKLIFEHDMEVWGGTLGVDEKGQYQLTKKFTSNQLPSESLANS